MGHPFIRPSFLKVGVIHPQHIHPETAGKMLVSQGASAEPAWVPMSGDATMDASGNVTVSAGAIAPTDVSIIGKAATNIAASDMCYVSGLTSAGVAVMSIAKADEAGKYAQWVSLGAVASGSTGTFRVAFDSTANLNTFGLTVGDPIFLTPTGTTGNTWSAGAPAGTIAVSQVIGHVKVVDVAVGVIGWNLIQNPISSYGSASVKSGLAIDIAGTAVHASTNATTGVATNVSAVAAGATGSNTTGIATNVSAVAAGNVGGSTTGITAAASGNTGASGTGAVTGSAGSNTTGISGSTATETLVMNPASLAPDLVIAAKSVNSVHAAYADNQVNLFPGPIVDPAIARNLVCTFGVGWTGGDVLVHGDTLSGNTTETFADPGAGGGTVVGAKMFFHVQDINKTVVAGIFGGSVEVGTGDVIGLQDLQISIGVVAVNGVTEVGTWDAANRSCAPTTIPNGALKFNFLYPRNKSITVNVTDTGHDHSAGSLTGPSHDHTSSAINITDAGHDHTSSAITVTNGAVTDTGHDHTSSAITVTNGAVTDAGHTH